MVMLFLISLPSEACKIFGFNQEYPITDFSHFSHIVVVKIDEASHDDSLYKYNRLISFNAKVLDSIKGDLKVGHSFTGKALSEEAHAVCPISLDNGKSYLLLLNSLDGKYILSRFSAPVSNTNAYFSSYVEQVKNAYNKPFKQDK